MTTTRCRKISVLVGGILLSTPLAVTHFYGNLLPYLASYFQARKDSMIYFMDPLWMATMFRSFFSLAMVFTSPMELRFGKFPCIIAGAIGMCVSVLSGYVAVDEPMALTLTFGVTHGIAVGVVYSLTLKLLLQIWDDKGGTAVGFMAIGPPLGAMINIGMAYCVINPTNKEADLRVGKHVYFSDDEIIHNVPHYFLVMGGGLVLSNVIGISLLYYGSSNFKHESFTQATQSSTNRKSNGQSGSASLCDRQSHVCRVPDRHDEPLKSAPTAQNRNYNSTTSEDGPTSREQCNDKAQNGNYQSTISEDGPTSRGQCNDKAQSSCEEIEALQNETSKQRFTADFSPKEMLCTRQFWLVWLCCLGISHSFYIHLSLYKEYGQLTIPNDALLASLAMLGMVGMIVIMGLFSDKFGICTTAFAMCASSGLFMGLVVVGFYVSAAMFVIMTLITFVLVSLQLMVISLLTSHFFGQTHYASNMGLVCSGQFLLIFLEPFIVAAITNHLGWDFLFLSGSLSAAVAAVAEMALEGT